MVQVIELSAKEMVATQVIFAPTPVGPLEVEITKFAPPPGMILLRS